MYRARIEGTQNILDMFDKLHGVDEVLERALFQAGKDTVESIKERIASGRNTDGEMMITRSNPKYGRYSKMRAEQRQRRGLRIDLINLKFDGDMLEDFKVISSFRTSCTIGFTKDTEIEKADTNEYLFGQIFDVEENIIDKQINNIDKAVFETIN